MEKIDIISMAKAMNAHAAARQSVVARNVANADTPGYKAADLPDFTEVWRAAPQGSMRATRPGHLTESAFTRPAPRPVADANGDKNPNGNTVSLETEMLRAAEIKREHDLSLTIYKSALGLMRSSLGRR